MQSYRQFFLLNLAKLHILHESFHPDTQLEVVQNCKNCPKWLSKTCSQHRSIELKKLEQTIFNKAKLSVNSSQYCPC